MLKPLGDRVIIELVESEEKPLAVLSYRILQKKNRKKVKLLQQVQVVYLKVVSALR